MAKYELFSVPQIRHSFPAYPPFSIDLGFRASLEAELALDLNSITSVTTSASLDGEAVASVGVGAGFSVCGVGVSLSGGVEGGIALEGRSSLTFTVNSSNLDVAMPAATLNLDMIANLYLDVPGFDIGIYDADSLAEDVASLHGSLGSSGRRITYRIGSIRIIEATTPSYSITFEVTRGRFSGASASGSWRFALSREIKQAFEYIKQKISQALDAAVDVFSFW